MNKPGRPKSSFHKTAVGIGTHLAPEVYARVNEMAVSRRRSKAFILREIIDFYFEAMDEQKK